MDSGGDDFLIIRSDNKLMITSGDNELTLLFNIK